LKKVNHRQGNNPKGKETGFVKMTDAGVPIESVKTDDEIEMLLKARDSKN
jgi:hypothetical protein